MLKHWFDAMERAIQEVKQSPETAVQVFHHNDADGITSGAILTRALNERVPCSAFLFGKAVSGRAQKSVRTRGAHHSLCRFCGANCAINLRTEQGKKSDVDSGSPCCGTLNRSEVHNLDPDLFGLKGDRDISGSTTCHLFAVTMDPRNHDLAPIAAVGAVADGFFVEGRLVSQNRDAALEAVQQGKFEIQETENGEKYWLKNANGKIPVLAFGDYLDLLGGVGYYQNGPDMGVKVCLDGVSPELDKMVEELKATRKKIFDEEIARLQEGGWKQAPHIQWFHVGNRFFPMGVKMIGAFCDAIWETKLIDPYKYLAGFQIIPDEIPGFGKIKFNDVKISMRVSPYMEGEIRAGRIIGLNILLPEATNRLGGFSDACHSLTAATTVAIGKEEQLIEEMEKIIEGEANG